MISKEYHHVINFGIVANFYLSIDPAYPGSLAKDLSQQVNSVESGFSLLHRSSSPLSTMSFERVYWNSTYKVFVFYFHRPCLLYPQYNLSLQALFCFNFPHFYFPYTFVVLQKSTSQPAVLKGHKQRTLVRGSNLKGHRPLFWISVNLSDAFKTQMKQKKYFFYVQISRREKDGSQSVISLWCT